MSIGLSLKGTNKEVNNNLKVRTNTHVMEFKDTILLGTSLLQQRKQRCKDNLLEDLNPKIWLLQGKKRIIYSIKRSGNSDQTQKFSEKEEIKS